MVLHSIQHKKLFNQAIMNKILVRRRQFTVTGIIKQAIGKENREVTTKTYNKHILEWVKLIILSIKEILEEGIS